MQDALDRFPEIAARLRERPPVLFLDYDGTLTPIVDDPAAADLDPAMRARLRRVAGRFRVAIVSGRDLLDVGERVGIDGLFYAGSHGFDIRGPGKRLEQPDAQDYLPALERAELALRDELGATRGVVVERKRFAIAVHYRRVAQDQLARIESVVAEVAERQGLERDGGKKVFELQPPVAWNKGRALHWLLDALDTDPERVTPIYLGDDRTDEDAFRALPQHGIGILVGEHGGRSAAAYRLADPEAVGGWLERLLALKPGVRASDE